jgi:leucyl-tRNA synthetase
VKRIFEFVDKVKFGKDSGELNIKLNNVIKNVSKYYENFQYRKATIELRALFDLMENSCSKKTFEKFLKMLSPIMPHITEELWNKLGNEDLISVSSWPKFDEKKLKVKKKEVDLNEKVIELVKRYLKGRKVDKIYLYVVPFEVEKLDVKKLEKELGKKINIFSVKDENKYDPEGKAKRARPGQPGVFFE